MNEKVKHWLDKKSRDGQKKKRKRIRQYIKNRKRATKRSETENRKKDNTSQIKRLSLTRCVPEVFSFTQNPEGTINFFEKLADELAQNKRRKFRIESKDVKEVTVDALIYLLALMNNFGMLNKHNFEGTMPKDIAARKIYEESGFLDYMEFEKKGEIKKSSENIRIVSGEKNNADIVTTITKFAEEKLKKTRKELITLNPIFIEMMSNVYYHAYSKKSKVRSKRWYIYAEHIEDFIRIIFIDTGMGIANTVKKNRIERAVEFLKIERFLGKTDAELMKSAFEGEFRTQTNEKHRGNGLATIYDKVQDPIYKNIKVISGRGQCDLLCDGIITKDYESSVMGTLYVFELK